MHFCVCGGWQGQRAAVVLDGQDQHVAPVYSPLVHCKVGLLACTGTYGERCDRPHSLTLANICLGSLNELKPAARVRTRGWFIADDKRVTVTA